MDVREKLVEIIQNSVGGCARHWAEVIADGLLAHGVTVQEWISVKDRLPEICTQVLCFTGSSVQIAMYEGNDRWFTNYHSYTFEGKNLFTHWMPLPQPPKGE